MRYESLKRRLGLVALSILLLVSAFASSERQQTYLAFLGDTGSGDRPQKRVSIQLNRMAENGKLDYVFLLGDNIYPKGDAKHIKPKFLDIYRKLFAKDVPFHAALGNHDVKRCEVSDAQPLPRDERAYIGCDVGSQLTEARFGYPEGRRYYSVRSEGSPPLFEIFAVDTNTLAIREYLDRGLPEDTAQLDWLNQALARSKAVWKIVIMHNAMHTPRPATFFGQGHRPEYAMRQQLEGIFRTHGVDVVFQAHNHFYSRLVPQNGIRYFVTGGGGNKRIYKFKREPGYAVDIEGRGRFHHFTHVRLTQEHFEFCAIDLEGRVRDAGSFRKGDLEDSTYSSGCPF